MLRKNFFEICMLVIILVVGAVLPFFTDYGSLKGMIGPVGIALINIFILAVIIKCIYEITKNENKNN